MQSFRSIAEPPSDSSTSAGSLPERVAALEKELLIEALKSSRGNISAAARRLGISTRRARYKINKLGIDYRQFLARRR